MRSSEVEAISGIALRRVCSYLAAVDSLHAAPAIPSVHRQAQSRYVLPLREWLFPGMLRHLLPAAPHLHPAPAVPGQFRPALM